MSGGEHLLEAVDELAHMECDGVLVLIAQMLECLCTETLVHCCATRRSAKRTVRHGRATRYEETKRRMS